MSVRAIVVDDEPLARRRLRRLLKVHDDVEVIGEATNGDEAVSVALEAHPDVRGMDGRRPGSDGVQGLLLGIRAWAPDGWPSAAAPWSAQRDGSHG